MQRRIRLVSLFVFFGFLCVLGKLFYWQVFQSKPLSFLASNQYLFSQKVLPDRGEILTSDDFPLAMNIQTYQLFADPSQLSISADMLLASLQKYIKDKKIEKKTLKNKQLYWVLLADNLGRTEKEEIEKLEIKGLGFNEKNIRYYPEASMSAHLLGFVGKDDIGQDKGYFGLEGYYDKELKGKLGKYTYEADALRRPLPLGEAQEEEFIPGRQLKLNIDRRLQFLTENHLARGIEKYQALSGLVLIVNPKNGAVLTMASFPSYHPGSYFMYSQNSFRNPAISSVYEPGSIFKVIVMASALDAKAVSPQEICLNCAGPRKIADYTIKTWNDKYYPNSTLQDILAHSDNVGMVYIAEKLGENRFLSYLTKFKLGEKTKIDLQGEISVPLKAEKDWREIDLATASFGQGIALTPIQILTAVSAIANKGVLFQPQVVKSIVEKDREIIIKPVNLGRAISSQTADLTAQLMERTVERGEAKWAKPAGYKIAGKTGTAQIPIAGHYDPEKTIASFIGFAPVDDPKFAMLVILNEPKSSPWGSETAAPLWFEIAGDIFRLLAIPPSRQ